MIFDYNLTYQVLVEKFYILPCLGMCAVLLPILDIMDINIL
jgi:hypothetical protein